MNRRVCDYVFQSGPNAGTKCQKTAKYSRLPGEIFCSLHRQVPPRMISVKKVVTWQGMVIDDKIRCDNCAKNPEYLHGSTYLEQFYTFILCAKQLNVPLCQDIRKYLFDLVKPIIYIVDLSDGSKKLHLDEYCDWILKVLDRPIRTKDMADYYMKVEDTKNKIKEMSLIN